MNPIDKSISIANSLNNNFLHLQPLVDPLLFILGLIGLPIFLIWVLLREVKRRESQEALLLELLRERRTRDENDSVPDLQSDKDKD